jgi:hypothetical protein
MGKIELTERQKELIQSQLNGTYSPFTSSEEDQIAFNDVIDKAETLCDEMDAYDEMGVDLLAWFWKKYQDQEAQKND